MPLLTFTRPVEAKRWVPWWAAIFFTDHHARGRKRGAGSASQKYQYEIRRKPVSQRSRAATGTAPTPPSTDRIPQHTTTRNELFSLPPPHPHRHVHFHDEPPWTNQVPVSGGRGLPSHQFLADNPNRYGHEHINSQDMHDARVGHVHKAQPTPRHTSAHVGLKERPNVPLSFLDGRTGHCNHEAHPRANTFAHRHCKDHGGPHFVHQDIDPESDHHHTFYDALQRQFAEDLSYESRPNFHRNDGFTHPMAQRYHVHRDEPWQNEELPWHMKVGHRGHIHLTHRALHHQPPPKHFLPGTNPQLLSPYSDFSHPVRDHDVCTRDPIAQRRPSYERRRSPPARRRHESYHRHPLRCHPTESGQEVPQRIPWDKSHYHSPMSPYSSML